MTRWARAGSAQKHKKLPGDATKWGEFDLQGSSGSSSEQKGPIKKNNPCGKTDTVSTRDISVKKHSASQNHEKSSYKDTETRKSESYFQNDEKASNSVVNVKPNSTNEIVSSADNELSKNTSPKKLKNKQNIFEQNNVDDAKNPQTSDMKTSKKKKLSYAEKLKKRRAENGILLLPAKVERKLYNIKRRLREKGVPPAVIKDISRKERRKAELAFRKDFNPSKLCFNCRQPGHMLADCPTKLGSSSQQTGICFKCGSVDHTSFKCTEEVQGFPFAKCFICKEQGHISKDCPRNKHGVYPKGGRCNLCGNVNHLKKDCPSLRKRKEDESTITLETLNEGASIDAEALDISLTRKNVKKPKIVKF